MYTGRAVFIYLLPFVITSIQMPLGGVLFGFGDSSSTHTAAATTIVNTLNVIDYVIPVAFAVALASAVRNRHRLMMALLIPFTIVFVFLALLNLVSSIGY